MECIFCHTPYPEKIAKVARAHHELKLRMVERARAKPEEIASAEEFFKVRDLGRFSEAKAREIKNTTDAQTTSADDAFERLNVGFQKLHQGYKELREILKQKGELLKNWSQELKRPIVKQTPSKRGVLAKLASLFKRITNRH